MRNLTRTIILILAVNIIFAGFVLAQVSQVESPIVGNAPSAVGVPVATPPIPEPEHVLEMAIQHEAALEADRIQDMLIGLSQRISSSDTASVLVIPTEQIGTQQILEINEDLNIMSQILKNELDKERITSNIDRQRATTVTGGAINLTNLSLNRNSQTIDIMYLQDYGALFSMNVDFPLSATSDTQEQEQAEDQGDNTVWAQTRRQIYEPSSSRSRPSRLSRRSETRYDAQRVENLKTTMLQVLKQASNIRVLEADESVILSITGRRQSGLDEIIPNAESFVSITERASNQVIVTYRSNGDERTQLFRDVEPEDIVVELAAPMVLVVRAKKSDIDAFAQGQLSLVQFRQNAQIISYPLLSEISTTITTRGNSSRGRGSSSSSINTSGPSSLSLPHSLTPPEPVPE